MKKYNCIYICAEDIDIDLILDYMVDRYNYTYIDNDYDETLVLVNIYDCISIIKPNCIKAYIGENINGAYDYLFDIYIDSLGLSEVDIADMLHFDITDCR